MRRPARPVLALTLALAVSTLTAPLALAGRALTVAYAYPKAPVSLSCNSLGTMIAGWAARREPTIVTYYRITDLDLTITISNAAWCSVEWWVPSVRVEFLDAGRAVLTRPSTSAGSCSGSAYAVATGSRTWSWCLRSYTTPQRAVSMRLTWQVGVQHAYGDWTSYVSGAWSATRTITLGNT